MFSAKEDMTAGNEFPAGQERMRSWGVREGGNLGQSLVGWSGEGKSVMAGGGPKSKLANWTQDWPEGVIQDPSATNQRP